MEEDLKFKSSHLLKNKKGLSTVITTLIIILLVFVAIGIIWVVVRGVIEEGAGEIEISSKCLNLDIRAIAVASTGANNYDVTLKRSAGGDEIAGIRIVVFNDTQSSGVITSEGNIEPLDTVTRNINAGTSNANKVEVTAYLKDGLGKEQLCSQTNTFNF